MSGLRSDEALRGQLLAIVDELDDEDERRYIDRLQGARAVVEWSLGLRSIAPVSGVANDERPSLATARRENDLAEEVLRGQRRGPFDVSRDFVLGAIEALSWATGASDEAPASMPVR